MPSINAKLGNMRKSVDWTVYPAQKDGRIVIQSSKRIAQFQNDGTNKGLLSKHCRSGAYFVHLSPMCGATEVHVPQDIIDAAVAAQPKSGDVLGAGGGVVVFIA